MIPLNPLVSFSLAHALDDQALVGGLDGVKRVEELGLRPALQLRRPVRQRGTREVRKLLGPPVIAAPEPQPGMHSRSQRGRPAVVNHPPALVRRGWRRPGGLDPRDGVQLPAGLASLRRVVVPGPGRRSQFPLADGAQAGVRQTNGFALTYGR